MIRVYGVVSERTKMPYDSWLIVLIMLCKGLLTSQSLNRSLTTTPHFAMAGIVSD